MFTVLYSHVNWRKVFIKSIGFNDNVDIGVKRYSSLYRVAQHEIRLGIPVNKNPLLLTRLDGKYQKIYCVSSTKSLIGLITSENIDLKL
jgi:hypothetical protein